MPLPRLVLSLTKHIVGYVRISKRNWILKNELGGDFSEEALAS